MTQLTIYAADARTVLRQTTHATRPAAFRALRRYEARHGRHPNSIDRLPQPHPNDAPAWDAYRLRGGIAAR